MVLTPNKIVINRIAQGDISLPDGVAWFQGLTSTEQQDVLHELAVITVQAHPLPNEAQLSIERSGLKATFTPCVQLLNATIPEKACFKIAALPEDEWVKSFKLLLSLFSLADMRRRSTTCRDGCTHEWHNLPQNLH